jgi:hypothetical protein
MLAEVSGFFQLDGRRVSIWLAGQVVTFSSTSLK